MPLTPFHYPIAFGISRLDKRLNLPGLIVGSMFPDLEIPVIIAVSGNWATHRLVLHSVLGALTVGTLLSTLFTVVIYPTLVSSLFGVPKHRVKDKARLSFTLLVSALVGNISHVLLDLTNHLDNPLFWPFSQSVLSPICLTLRGTENAALIVHTMLVALFALLLVKYTRLRRGSLWENLLVAES